MNTLIMPAAAARFNHVIAFDVSKASLSLHILPSGETLSLQNDGAAIRRLLKREQKRNRKQGLGPMLVICEATGGYEDAVLKTACTLGLDCHRAHGSGVRAYAKFRGRHAKNDPIDAALLAEYGRDKPDLELYQPPGGCASRLNGTAHRTQGHDPGRDLPARTRLPEGGSRKP